MAAENLDLVLFLGDYIYEYATPATATRVRRHDGELVRTLAAIPRPLRAVQERRVAAGDACARAVDRRVGRPRGRQRLRRATSRRRSTRCSRAARRGVPGVLGAHAVPAARSARGEPRCASTIATTGACWRASTRSTTASTATRKPARAPDAAAPTNVLAEQCPVLLDEKRSLLGAEQERWLAEGWSARAPLEPACAADADGALRVARPGALAGRALLDRWLGRLPGVARGACSQARASARSPNVVVLGGDVHANYVADLKIDYDDARSPVVAHRVLRHVDLERRRWRTSASHAALPFNPHIRYARATSAATCASALDARRLHAQLRVVDNVLDPQSGIQTAARFVVEAGKAGAQPA